MPAPRRKYGNQLYVGYTWFFKAFLVFGLIGVIALFIYFNLSVVYRLRQDATKVSEAYAHLIQYGASEATDPAVINFIFENIITKVNFPIIVTDKNGIPAAWTMDYNLADTSTQTRKKLYQLIKEFDGQNPPIQITSSGNAISVLHYGDSELIRRLQLIPVIEISVVGFFILVAFIGFRNIKQSEQRSIWVGMAKETAHQLGTPLSSLIGWVELLKLKNQEGKVQLSGDFNEGNFNDVTDRMLTDLKRLDRIATRFGRIGSAPELTEHSINDVVKEVVDYFRFRLPAGGVVINEEYGDLPDIKINSELMGWVVENLVKNSMEAVNPKTGVISLRTSFNANQRKICVVIEDNGRGIAASEHGKIFSPGFTTKKRGWGLGLTLARRIVEEYHGGRISLRTSEPGIRTVFMIELPV
jgi:signal transduction histidine kinase